MATTAAVLKQPCSLKTNPAPPRVVQRPDLEAHVKPFARRDLESKEGQSFIDTVKQARTYSYSLFSMVLVSAFSVIKAIAEGQPASGTKCLYTSLYALCQ